MQIGYTYYYQRMDVSQLHEQMKPYIDVMRPYMRQLSWNENDLPNDTDFIPVIK
jgi:hypothetical protein